MAVYTHLSHQEIRTLLQAYDVGELLQAQGIAEGVENSNYLLHTEQHDSRQRYILTVFEQRVEAEDLPFYLGLMQHMAQNSIPAPRPIAMRNGQLTGRIAEAGKSFALVSFLQGQEPHPITTAHVTALGATVARMHLAAKDYAGKRPNSLSLAGWRRLYEKTAEDSVRFMPGLKEDIAEELHSLMHEWPSPQRLPAGVVHTDLFPDNVFFTGDAVSGVIDFYFSCNDSWMYDLMIVLNAWCFDADAQFCPERSRALFAGYESVRPLTDDEWHYMPVLARGAALRFFLTRLHDWLYPVEGAVVRVKDPMEYYRKLCFHRAITHLSAYGL